MGQCAHLKSYTTVPACEVVAIAELRPKLAKKVAARYGVPHVYRDYQDMLASEQVDGIVASQPFERHGLLLPELLKPQVPLFTEKPLARSVETGEGILRALEATNTWHMVGYHKRSDPATIYAKAEIDRLKKTGELGGLRYARILMPEGDWEAGGLSDLISSDDPQPELEIDPPASDMDEESDAHYVSFVNDYIHQINLMRHLLGEAYELTYVDPSGVLVAGCSETGVPCAIEINPYTTTIDWQESALVAFEHGYVKLDLPAPLVNNRPGRVEILRDPGGGTAPEAIVPHLPWVHAMRQQAIHFISAIRGECRPPCEAAEALEDLRVARQYISLRSGV
jgi:predicted dehydrogenase